MSTPYVRGLKAVDLTSGQPNCVPIACPPRGTLRRIIVRQTSGALEGFSYDLLDRSEVCADGTTTTPEPSTAEPLLLHEELHKLQATQVVAGSASTSAQYAAEILYENRDARPEKGLAPTARLYVEITPAGTGDKDFEIVYTIDSYIE